MRYVLLAVDDDMLDFVVEENDKQPFIHGVKQVVLDGINFDEAERVAT